MPSSVIKQFNYNRDHARLTVTFTTGRVYEYYAVPAEIYAAFRTALSKGTFFNTRIRDHFPFKEVTPRKRA
ncbi:MAG: KTSC domain-containing protein [Pseudolabrys sp.]|nr:KTSC domain-containing protein [Pseudolabrys sp.]MBV9262018.1 KTSC domain-containing protein [Pseudolabrys sp.]